MTTILRKGLLQSRLPLLQLARSRGKINIQRPRKPHYDRALLNNVTQSSYKETVKTENCFQEHLIRKQLQTENPYNAIIAREVLNWLSYSKMVGIFHLNSIKADDYFKCRVAFHKQNMHLKSYGKKVIKEAVENSPYESILPLFDSSHCIVFSSEQNVQMLLKVSRKFPQMILIAGIIDNNLMNRNELAKYALVSNLQQARGQLINVLSMAGAKILRNLVFHQKAFVNVMDVYMKSNKVKTTNTVNEIPLK